MDGHGNLRAITISAPQAGRLTELLISLAELLITAPLAGRFFRVCQTSMYGTTNSQS